MAHQNLAAAAMVQQYVANLDPSVQKLLQLLYDSHVELENKLAKKAEEYNKLLQVRGTSSAKQVLLLQQQCHNLTTPMTTPCLLHRMLINQLPSIA